MTWGTMSWTSPVLLSVPLPFHGLSFHHSTNASISRLRGGRGSSSLLPLSLTFGLFIRCPNLFHSNGAQICSIQTAPKFVSFERRPNLFHSNGAQICSIQTSPLSLFLAGTQFIQGRVGIVRVRVFWSWLWLGRAGIGPGVRSITSDTASVYGSTGQVWRVPPDCFWQDLMCCSENYMY
ncbi:hypothetical protein NEOLEDRAFT_507308 [Neolentinus lepideus HHB14362 ss-1]|uniref:Uncharacterized protein n=1 Tax=Neolentinus lepideus HHB14362 ss-1 TaxID=1314782 RepID=A0A165RJX3_9AGAM|nr:hypothetical protein NEOLEDRAFT_507308 [Neolentinus lepideus HHB14362 ss-1]